MNKFGICNFLIFLSLINFYCVNTELIFVYEHSRHGIRSPIFEIRPLFYNVTKFYDEYNTQWDGDGVLTLKGKMQHYILGIRNRYKYPNLMNYSKYNPNELLIHVTNITRVKESAYNQLLGMFNPIIVNISEKQKMLKEISEIDKLYYPPNYNIWKYKESIKYKNIINEAELSIKLLEKMNRNSKIFLTEGIFDLKKINEKNKNNVKFLPFSKNRTFYIETDCENYRQYIHHNYKKDFFKLVENTLKKKYGEKLNNFFKYNNKKWLATIHDIFSFTDVYISNYYEGKNLKEFFDLTGIDKEEYFITCYNIYKWWLYHIYCDEKVCVLDSSKLMEDLIEYMENKINNKSNELKMVIDLGHDATVGPMQVFMHKAFNVDYTVCDFACNVFFELHKERNNKKDSYFVKYYVDDELRLKINYELFKKNVISTIWTEKEKDDFCRGNILRILYPNGFLFFSVILIALFLGIFILFIYKCYILYLKNNNKNTLSNQKENELNLINKKGRLNKNKNIEKQNEYNKELEEI